MKTRIRQRYPVTATAFREAAGSGVAHACLWRLYPPHYTSRGGRVHRWSKLPQSEMLWAIRGRGAAMEIIPVKHTTRIQSLRAFGSHDNMQSLARLAVKDWIKLPSGREIETLFDLMFPLKLELETTPLVVKPAKPKRRKAA